MSAQELVLETSGLTRDYGRRRVVDGLDLAVPAGCVYGFLGPNGAGKSTTLRMVLGLIRPTAGRVALMGQDIARHRLTALRQVGAQVETPAFYPYLSAWRNLRIFSQLTGRVPDDELRRVLERVRLLGREHDRVRTYSQGMRMRLGLAQALLPRPRFLLLDEPTNGLDPQGMKEVRELIGALAREEGVTVFLSSHLLGEVQQVCDRVAVINRGKLVAEGPVETLLREAGEARVGIACDDLTRALDIARGQRGVRGAEIEDERLLVSLEQEAVAPLNAALVTAGIAVSELVPLRRTLEEFFLEVTGEPA